MKEADRWPGSARVLIVVIMEFWVPNSSLSFLSQGPLSAASEVPREWDCQTQPQESWLTGTQSQQEETPQVNNMPQY